MNLTYAHYPSLMEEFLSFIASAQSSPAERVLVLCPSRRLSGYLQQQLALRQGVAANIFFQDFAGLLRALDGEKDQPGLPLLPGDHIHNFILKTILQRPGSERFPTGRGFVSALRASLRDLADSLAEPQVLSEHLRTSSDPKIVQELPYLEWLVSVYDQYLRETAAVPGFRSYQQFFEDALSQINASRWLGSFKHIVFYGFYDLTGRQLELFNRVRMEYPVTAFAPYIKHPAYNFAQKFFETNLLGAASKQAGVELNTTRLALGQTADSLFAAASSARPKNLTVASCAGAGGELFFVVKEILKLVDEPGFSFSDIAVVARSLEPYKQELPGVFAANGIAVKSNLTFYLPSLPLGIFCLNLLSLLRGGFYREDVLAVVSSAYFKQKNNWRYLIDQSLAERDYSQWLDLVPPETPQSIEFLAWLEQCKTQLERLNAPGRWGVLAQQAAEFLRQNTDEEVLGSAEKTLFDEILNIVSGLTRYETLRMQTREGEFLDELMDALKNVEQHRVEEAPNGVSVVDALNARGLQFKAVFVLGLNEKMFPQVLREDPVLKDFYRRTLRDGLGFWMNQKLERLDEEKLLFFAAVTSASERLFLTFQRVSDEGKALVPSSFLAETARAAGLDLQGDLVQRVSGRLLERLMDTPVGQLTQKEVSLLLCTAENAPAAYEQAGLLTDSTGRSLQAAAKLSTYGALTAYDGVVSSGPAIFDKSNTSGFSPSTLQDLGHCPMKYFFSKGVGLREKDDVLSRFELAPNLRGEAYHQILMDFYKEIYDSGIFNQLFASGFEQRLEQAAERNYTEESYKKFGIYPVIWEIILEDIKTKLSAFVQKDVENMGPFIPSVFETLFEGLYSPSPELKLRVKGYIDRIDINTQDKTLRIVDYKSSQKGGKELSTEILKHLILQPFIYWSLAENAPQFNGAKTQSAVLLNINKGYSKQELTAEGFDLVKPKADAFLNLLAGFVRGGTFFLNLSGHCEYCPFTAICRKDSFRSLMRARHSPEYIKLEEARQI